MTINATPGSPTANSYATLVEADAYHATRLHNAAWTGADDSIKEAALIWATRTIDDNMFWKGVRSTEDQSLEWPRQSVVDEDGYVIGFDIVPIRVKNAQAEQAFLLIKSDPTIGVDPKSPAAIKKVKAGSLEAEFESGDRPGVLNASVVSQLQIYGVFSGAGSNKKSRTVNVVRS